MTDKSTLEQRLQLLEDLQEIQRTFNQYARGMDNRDEQLLLDCFLPDGVWRSTAEGKWAGAGGITLEGHTQLAEWLRQRPPTTPGHRTRHMSVSPDILATGDRATAETYFCSMHETESGPVVFSLGRYIDSLERCPDGRWRFRKRHLARDSVIKSAQDIAIGRRVS